MKYRVKILPDALQDAKEIYQWIAQDSPANAARWFNGLFDAIDSLSTMPLRATRAPESEIIGVEIRQYIYRKNYRILFIVEGDIVRIHHIRRGSRRWMGKDEFSS